MDLRQLKEKVQSNSNNFSQFFERNFNRITEKYVQEQMINILAIKFLKKKFKNEMRAKVMSDDRLMLHE